MLKINCLLSVIIITFYIFLYSDQNIYSQTSPPTHRIYSHLMDPREHPDYNRHFVHPPDWNTFGNRTNLIYITDFDIKDDCVVNYVQALNKYTDTYDLGNVYKVTYPLIYVKNLENLAVEFKKRNLFLFSLYGYVPGSGPGGFWRQYKAPDEALKLLESKLGDHWLGLENGEQDGRYIGGYASQLYPASASRLEQYFNFQRHFEKHGDDVGNRMALLVSLNFAHHFTKEGVYSLIGAETAQALPNSQVYYAFLRGAGKQYGVPWFGNASVFNRWGYKSYEAEQSSSRVDYNRGPTKGASVNLLKRLLYSHILYNSMCVGIDLSLFEGDKLSPLGRVQHFAQQWLKQNGQPGVMLAPVAIMLDFFSGWSFPRHLYSSNLYRVWGNLPYESGDYLIDGVLDMIYPDYQNSSYYHDESGFLSPTPYGDYADCLLSDAPEWLLERYPLLVIAGELSGGVEIRDKLQSYIEKGGHLFITAGSLSKLPGGLAGITVDEKTFIINSSQKIQYGVDNILETVPFKLCSLTVFHNSRVLARVSTPNGDVPAVIGTPVGKGLVTVFASPFGLGTKGVTGETIKSEIDKPLPKPFPLLKHVRVVLDKAFKKQMLFEVGENLSLITCRRSEGNYILGIFNNSLSQQPFQIISHCGAIESVRELILDQSEKGAIGYLPEGFEKTNIGISNDWNIAGGDVRIFEVRIREEGVEKIAHTIPPLHPEGRALSLRSIKSIKEEILSRPTFFDHFDRVVVDWKYLRQREKNQLRQEMGWIKRQKLGIIVDLTSGINLFPDIRMVNNDETEYMAGRADIEDVMSKMELIDEKDLILSLHRIYAVNITREQYWRSFETTLSELSKRAESHKITMYLRMCPNKEPRNLNDAVQLLDRISVPNLRLAPSITLILAGKFDRNEIINLLKDKVGLWLVSAPEFDIANNLWNANAPISKYKEKSIIADILSIAPNVPIILDGLCNNQDEEYLDARALDSLISKITE